MNSVVGARILILLTIIMLLAIVSMRINQPNIQGLCMEHGYPDYQIHGDKSYCIRLVDGNQVVINVNDLE
jgi:hypothetical protein